jgi:Cu-Zn family superoxide dismutase
MKKLLSAIITLFLSLNYGAAFAATGVAVIKGTKEGSSVSGKVFLTDTTEGLKVSADLKGVLPGKHGFHIHENGACGDEGKAAGGHYNPDKVSHGFLPKDGLSHAHAGDLGNIDVAQDGTGKLDAVLPGVTLTGGKYDVVGKAIILHEKEDDFGQPTGNAGGRIGCGVIEVTNS